MGFSLLSSLDRSLLLSISPKFDGGEEGLAIAKLPLTKMRAIALTFQP